MNKVVINRDDQIVLSGGCNPLPIGFLDPQKRGHEFRAFLFKNPHQPDQGTDQVYGFTKGELKEKVRQKYQI